ncbi:30S ribosomal protein S21 [compost metagenome]|nr:small subunit ribosomal protein S21 [Sphingobacterium detergens]
MEILYLCPTLNFKSDERRYIQRMIIVNVKEGESLDRALKRFKKKFEKTGVLRELRSRQAYEKRSVTRRIQVKKAIYKQSLNQDVAN